MFRFSTRASDKELPRKETTQQSERMSWGSRGDEKLTTAVDVEVQKLLGSGSSSTAEDLARERFEHVEPHGVIPRLMALYPLFDPSVGSESCVDIHMPAAKTPEYSVAQPMNFMEQQMRQNNFLPSSCGFPSSAWIINTAFRFREASVDFAALREDLLKLFLPFLRFRSLACEDGRWEPTQVDPAYHFLLEADMGDGPSAVEKVLGALMTQSLDIDRPLWRIHVVPGPRGALVVFRVHHCVCDGLHLVRLLSTLCPKQPRWPVATKWSPYAVLPAVIEMAKALGEGTTGAVLSVPQVISASAKNVLSSMDAPDSFIPSLTHSDEERAKGCFGAARTIVLIPPHTLCFVKAMKKAYGDQHKTAVSLTTVLLSVFTGALRRYVDAQSTAPFASDTRFRISIAAPTPSSRRQYTKTGDANPDGLGNSFVAFSFDAALGETDAVERLHRTHKTLTDINVPVMAATRAFLANKVVPLFPQRTRQEMVLGFIKQHSLGFSNVPGPPDHITVGGAHIQSAYVVLATVNPQVTIMSYDGYLHVAAVVDPAVVTSPHLLSQFYLEELVDLGQKLGVTSDPLAPRPDR